MPRDMMAEKDTFAAALENVLETWDGQGAPEDVLEQALAAATDAEHGRRLLRHRKAMRGETDLPETPPEGSEHEYDDEEGDEDELPPLEA